MDSRVEELQTSPDIFVELKPGWQLDGAHCFGEDTLKAVRATMRRVRRCECDECRKVPDAASAEAEAADGGSPDNQIHWETGTMPTHLPNKVWNVYRKDLPLRADGTNPAVCQVRARDRREALDKAEDKFGPDSRGWLYVHTVTSERAAARLADA